MDKQRLLILGARGMLGTDLAHTLVDGFDLFLWDKDELDVTNYKQVLNAISELKPEIIINSTGYTNVDGAEDDKEVAFKINAEAVSFIASAAKEIQSKLVHFSTEYVFDGKIKNGYAEVAKPAPLNIYGESKFAGEEYITNYSLGYLVRTSWLYGHALQAGKPRGLNFIDTMIKLSNEAPEIKVVNDQYGKLTNTRDLAKAVNDLITGRYQPGIYHLVNESVGTWYEVAKEAFRIKDIKTPLIPISSAEYKTRARRPQYAVLLNTKFPKLRSWPEALRDYLT